MRSQRCAVRLALFALAVLAPVLSPADLNAQPAGYSFERAQTFLGTYCRSCHQGKSPAGGFNVQEVETPASVRTEAQRWGRIQTRVRIGEMPPRGLPAPALDQREQFALW